jgi:hypothetical protein
MFDPVFACSPGVTAPGPVECEVAVIKLAEKAPWRTIIPPDIGPDPMPNVEREISRIQHRLSGDLPANAMRTAVLLAILAVLWNSILFTIAKT